MRSDAPSCQPASGRMIGLGREGDGLRVLFAREARECYGLSIAKITFSPARVSPRLAGLSFCGRGVGHWRSGPGRGGERRGGSLRRATDEWPKLLSPHGRANFRDRAGSAIRSDRLAIRRSREFRQRARRVAETVSRLQVCRRLSASPVLAPCRAVFQRHSRLT